MSIRQLLNHTSGIRSFTAIPAFASKERLDLSDDELLAGLPERGSRLRARHQLPLQQFRVLPAGHGDRAPERAARTGYYMRDEVFVPLGLADTMACDDRQLIITPSARLHRDRWGVGERAVYQHGATEGRREPLLDGDGPGQVVERAGRGARHQPRVIPSDDCTCTLQDGRGIPYGFGLFLSTFDGRPEISHGGDIVGFTGFLGVYPADDLTVVTLTNSDTARLHDGHLARRLVGAVLGLAAGRIGRRVRRCGRRWTGSSAPYRIGSAVISVRQDGDSTHGSAATGIEQLSERVFTYQGGGMFAAVENPELRLTFTPVATAKYARFTDALGACVWRCDARRVAGEAEQVIGDVA